MKALTVVAATAYAIGLWMFAPRTVWERELATAKRNQQKRLSPTPEPAPEATPEPSPMPEPEPKQEIAASAHIEKIEKTPEPTPAPTPETPNGTDYTEWTTAQLREEAKIRKLNWRPLVNGKRTPLKKPQLIELLTM